MNHCDEPLWSDHCDGLTMWDQIVFGGCVVLLFWWCSESANKLDTEQCVFVSHCCGAPLLIYSTRSGLPLACLFPCCGRENSQISALFCHVVVNHSNLAKFSEPLRTPTSAAFFIMWPAPTRPGVRGSGAARPPTARCPPSSCCPRRPPPARAMMMMMVMMMIKSEPTANPPHTREMGPGMVDWCGGTTQIGPP